MVQAVRAASLSLGESAASFIGEAPYDNSGAKLSAAGDVNGDGYDDFFISAPQNDDSGENAGKIYLIFGKSAGWSRDQNLSQARVSFLGEWANDNAGMALAYVGDVNGDGYDDFAVGAPYSDDGGENIGKIYLFFGHSGKWKTQYYLAEAPVSFRGEKEEDNAGLAISFAGDVNGDGYGDFLIGAPLNSVGGENAGKAYLILGRTEWKPQMRLSQANTGFVGEDKGDRAGTTLAYIGDINNDGYDDFAIGAPDNSYLGEAAGQAYLFLGRSAGWPKNVDLSQAPVSFVGEGKGENVGSSLSFAGDVNGDEADDFLIGAKGPGPTGKSPGKCYLVLGSTAPQVSARKTQKTLPQTWKKQTPLPQVSVTIEGERKKEHFGVSVSGVEDTNGDGLDDFLVGASRNGEAGKKAGKSYLFWGRRDFPSQLKASEANSSFLGEKKYNFSGNTVSWAGDVNGDGLSDFLIGADSNNEGGRATGQTYLIFSRINRPPQPLSLELFSEHNYTNKFTGGVNPGDTLYLQVTGKDQDPAVADVAQIQASAATTGRLKINLLETGPNTGIYRGKLTLSNTYTNRIAHRLALRAGELITLTSWENVKLSAKVYQKVSFSSYQVEDDKQDWGNGNGNGYAEAGETIELKLRIQNRFPEKVTDVKLELATKDPYIKIVSSKADLGTLEVGQVQEAKDNIILYIDNLIPIPYLVKFRLLVYDAKMRQWEDSFTLDVSKIVSISGQVKNRYSGQGVASANLQCQGHETTSNQDGSYTLYLEQGDQPAELRIGAPGYLNVIQNLTPDKYRSGMDFSLPPRLELTKVKASFVGENFYDSSGATVCGAGDVNGDGYDDILIGAWGSDEGGTDAGKVYLILGRPTGWRKLFSLSRADASFLGEAKFDEAGKTIAAAGDVNGDGFADFLVGAQGNDAAGDKAGKTYLVFGKPNGWKQKVRLTDIAAASFTGENSHDRSGAAVAGIGDVTGDGYADFAIGAWGSGASGAEAGQTYLIFGKPAGWEKNTPLSQADASYVGENPRGESGKSIASAGDVNGDGYDDFLIGAPAHTAHKDFTGKTYLIFGKPSDWGWQRHLKGATASFIGEDSNDSSGSAVSSAGDVNRDGLGDFLIGAWASDKAGINTGATYLFLGKKEGWRPNMSLGEADASFLGEGPGDAAGAAVASAGDVSGDGYDDILIGAWGSDFSKTDQGQVYLVLGKPNGWELNTSLGLSDLSFVGKRAGDAAGRAVEYAGDLSGDGYDDLIIGAPGSDQGQSDAGETYFTWFAQNQPPLKITSLKLSSGQNEAKPQQPVKLNKQLVVELQGEDANPRKADIAEVLLESTSWAIPTRLRLLETGPDSGTYIGRTAIVPTSSSSVSRRVLAHGAHRIFASAKTDGSKFQAALVNDTRPPILSELFPRLNEARAPIATPISFLLEDPGAGVDKSSIKMWIAGQPVKPQITGRAESYLGVYNAPEIYDFDNVVHVEISAQDLASPPHGMKWEYTFKTTPAGIFYNSGFEKDLASWSVSPISGVSVTIDPTISHTGNKSCKIEFIGGQDVRYQYLAQGPLPVQPEREYLLSGFIKTEQLSGKQGVRLYVEGSNSHIQTLNSKNYFNAVSNHVLDTTDDWVEVAFPFTVPPGIKYIFVYLVRWDGGGGITGTCWLDG